MSNSPNSWSNHENKFLTDDLFSTSASRKFITCEPLAVRKTSSRGFLLLPQISTWYPYLFNSRAIARPIPLPPPTTKTFLNKASEVGHMSTTSCDSKPSGQSKNENESQIPGMMGTPQPDKAITT